MKKSIKRMQSSLLGLLSVRFLSNQKLLILLTILMVAINAYAYDFEVDGIYYNSISSSDVEVTYEKWNSKNYSGSVTIPTTVSNNGTTYSVTSIGNNAFSGCNDLTSVLIPNSVATISEYAFQGCSSLTSVIIPNSVTSIGDDAFSGCSGLTSIAIPNSVTSIGSGLFKECRGLTSINGKYASEDNRCLIVDGILKSFASAGLVSYSIPNSVTSIGDDAFSGCSGLTSIAIPNSVTSIGDQAFSGCSGLTSVAIPNSVTTIGLSSALVAGCF